METLRDLLNEVIERTGVSARELDRMAQKAGHRLAYSNVSSILNGTHGARYQRKTLEAIAAVGNFPLDRVYRAAEAPIPGRPFADDLPEGVDYLDADSRRAIIGVIRVLLKAQDAARPDNVTPLFPDRGEGIAHPSLPSVTRWPEDVDRTVAKPGLEGQPPGTHGDGHEFDT